MNVGTFFFVVLAVLLADFIFWFTLQIVKLRLKFRELPFYFSNYTYSLLVYVNNYAIQQMESGISRKEVAEMLPNIIFPFMGDDIPKKQNNQDAINYVKDILADRYLTETFICRNRFNKEDYNELCRIYKKPEDEKDALQIVNSIIKPVQIDTRNVIGAIAKWQTEPFLASQYSDQYDQRIGKGKNQVILYRALSKCLLKEGTTKKQFVMMMKSIGKLHRNTMEPVSESAMSQSILSEHEESIVQKAIETIKTELKIKD